MRDEGEVTLSEVAGEVIWQQMAAVAGEGTVGT
jgi:hypothetical protein